MWNTDIQDLEHVVRRINELVSDSSAGWFGKTRARSNLIGHVLKSQSAMTSQDKKKFFLQRVLMKFARLCTGLQPIDIHIQAL